MRKAEWPKRSNWVIERNTADEFLELADSYGLNVINVIANPGDSVQIGSGDETTVGDGEVGLEVVYSMGENEGFWNFTKNWIQLVANR